MVFLASQCGAILWENLKDVYRITTASYSLGRMQQNSKCALYDSQFFLQMVVMTKDFCHSLLLLWNSQNLLGCLNILYHII